jgi:hypothetical protein
MIRMQPLPPTLLAPLAEARVDALRRDSLPRAARPRRFRLTRRQPATAWGGGRTVNPCLAGRC